MYGKKIWYFSFVSCTEFYKFLNYYFVKDGLLNPNKESEWFETNRTYETARFRLDKEPPLEVCQSSKTERCARACVVYFQAAIPSCRR